MNQVKVIGASSKKIYASGMSRAECLRKLQRDYPTYEKGINKREREVTQIFPEALMIKVK